MARAPKKTAVKAVAKTTTKKTTARKKAEVNKVNPAVAKAENLISKLEKEISTQSSKVSAARKKLMAARSRVAENSSKAAQSALKKAMQEVRSGMTKLENLNVKNTLAKAELRAAKIMGQLADMEEKAKARVIQAESKLKDKTQEELDAAKKRFEQAWLKK